MHRKPDSRHTEALLELLCDLEEEFPSRDHANTRFLDHGGHGDRTFRHAVSVLLLSVGRDVRECETDAVVLIYCALRFLVVLII